MPTRTVPAFSISDTLVDQAGRKRDQWAFAEVVGAGLEADADEADLFLAGGLDHGFRTGDLRVIRRQNRVQYVGFRARAAGEIPQRAYVLRQAGTAEGEAGAHEIRRHGDLVVRAEDFHHRLPVDARSLGDVADLVGEGDLDRAPGVRSVFHQFRCADVGLVDMAGQRLVQRGQRIFGRLVHRAEDDQAGIIIILDGRAFTQELGIVAEAEALAGRLAGGRFQCRDTAFLGAAGHAGRAHDDAVVSVLRGQSLADVAAHFFDVFQADRSVGRRGRPDADERDLGIVDGVSGVGSGGQPSGGDDFGDKFADAFFDNRGLSGVD